MRIDDRLRASRRARSEKHGSAILFVELRINEVIVFRRQQFVVIEESGRNVTARVSIDDHPLKARAGRAQRLVNREQSVIDDQKSRAGMVGDRGEFLRMEPQIERVDDSAGAGDPEEAMDVGGVIPHHRTDAVAGLYSKSS